MRHRLRLPLLLAALALAALGPFPAAAEQTAPYAANTPFALWEVPWDHLDNVRYGQGIIVKSFSPGMNVTRYLDTADRYGFRVVLHFNDVVDYRRGTIYPGRIKAWTDRVRNHRALYGYLSVKEPSWNGISLSEMRSLYKAFRAQDTRHPVIALLGDAPHFGTSQNPWGTGVAQMLWIDWYPVTCSRGYLPTASTHFPKIRRYVAAHTPNVKVWLMVQGHTYYRGDRCTPKNYQLSRQVRDGFSYLRAKGIVFYTWNNPLYDRDLNRNRPLATHMGNIIEAVRNLNF